MDKSPSQAAESSPALVLSRNDAAGFSQVILSEPQRLAMEWLIGGGSVSEAAQYSGVTRQTVSGWINHDEDFKLLLQQWQDQTRAMTRARLVALSEQAIDTVVNAIREKRDAKIALTVLKSMGMMG